MIAKYTIAKIKPPRPEPRGCRTQCLRRIFRIVRKGRAVATIVKGKLYMMSFEAPEVYFFGKYETQFEQIVASAKLK